MQLWQEQGISFVSSHSSYSATKGFEETTIHCKAGQGQQSVSQYNHHFSISCNQWVAQYCKLATPTTCNNKDRIWIRQQLDNIFLFQDSAIFLVTAPKPSSASVHHPRIYTGNIQQPHQISIKWQDQQVQTSTKTALYNQQLDCSVHIRFAIKTTK